MDKLQYEKLKAEVNKIFEGENFKNAVRTTVENNLSYYEWLKKYLHCDNLNPIFSSEKIVFNYLIEYIYHCMIMDNYIYTDKSYTTSVVYFIRNEYNGLLKIGKTNDLKKRISQLQGCFTLLGMECDKLVLEAISYCPFGINASKVETYYHHLFSKNRRIGEWFDVDYDTLFSSLIIDDIVNGVLVTVEDSGDFPHGIKPIVVEESNISKLERNVTEEFIENIYKKVGIFDKNVFDFVEPDKETVLSSKEIYNYIMSLKSQEETKLNIKIKSKIEKIIKEVT